MGTQLMIAGLAQGNCGEAWNLRILNGCSPSSAITLTRIRMHHHQYLRGSRIMLTRHGELDHVVEINKAGVEIARKAFGGKALDENSGYVLGDIGPFAVSWFRSANH